VGDVNSVDIIPVRSHEEVQTVARLAEEIWTQHYEPIIGRDQVVYMLEKFQSPAAIGGQIRSGMEYFLLHCAQTAEGYFAIERKLADNSLFVSKLYVRQEFRGNGLARRALDFMLAHARERSLRTLWLTVNINNPAIDAYMKLGFRVTGPIVADIGGGYVMDDYRMERAI
jgi:ribosomal protein S18 acetylase RimI-like enzyme